MEFSLSDLLELITSGLSIEDYQYLNQLINHRTIVMNEAVASNIVEKVYLPLRDFENDDSDEPVTLILNSVGGSVSDGFFLANYLAGYSKKLYIIVCGYAASMATLILAAGGKNDNITRVCYSSSYGLIHDGQIAFDPTESKSVTDIMAFNELMDEKFKHFIVTHTKITEELYDSKARHQWFLLAEEMLELGLIDRIEGDDINGEH